MHKNNINPRSLNSQGLKLQHYTLFYKFINLTRHIPYHFTWQILDVCHFNVMVKHFRRRYRLFNCNLYNLETKILSLGNFFTCVSNSFFATIIICSRLTIRQNKQQTYVFCLFSDTLSSCKNSITITVVRSC